MTLYTKAIPEREKFVYKVIDTTEEIDSLIQEIKQRDDISNNEARFAIGQLEELRNRL